MLADIYSLPGPIGWVFQNQGGIMGNIVASMLWAGPPFLAGAVWGKRRARASDEHRERVEVHHAWMAEHLARHLEAQGVPVDPHPVDGVLSRLDVQR